MKCNKRLFSMALVISIFILISVNYVSAFSFGDFWNSVTGHAVKVVPDTTAPIISQTYPSSSGGVITYNNLNISVNTNENATCGYAFSNRRFTEMTLFDNTGGKTHLVKLNLIAVSSYTYYQIFIRCKDASGNINQVPYTINFTIYYATASNQSCNDSDNGLNYYVKGYVSDRYTASFQDGKLYDSCAIGDNSSKTFVNSCNSSSDCYATDAYCVGDNHISQAYNCPNGCLDGACIPLIANGSHYTPSDSNKTNNVKICTSPLTIISQNNIDGKIIVSTKQPSICGYSASDCNFNLSAGINMPYDDSLTHYANWDASQNYYIKCDLSTKSPDLTAPSIVSSGILYAAGDLFSFFVDVNEASICKWDISDKSYTEMSRDMNCSPQQNYAGAPSKCSSDYMDRGLGNNTFYIRCQDYSGNTMLESYKLQDINLYSNQDINPVIIPEINTSDINQICSGCISNNKCYPMGYRTNTQYCSANGNFTAQQDSDKKCNNNFECGSNACFSGKCLSESFIQKIINWFKKIFS